MKELAKKFINSTKNERAELTATLAGVDLKELLLELISQTQAAGIKYTIPPQLSMMLKLKAPSSQMLLPQLKGMCNILPELGAIEEKSSIAKEVSQEERLNNIIEKINANELPVVEYFKLLHENYFYKGQGNDVETKTFLAYALPQIKNLSQFLVNLKQAVGDFVFFQYVKTDNIVPVGSSTTDAENNIAKLDIFQLFKESERLSKEQKDILQDLENTTKAFNRLQNHAQTPLAVNIDGQNTHTASVHTTSNKWSIKAFTKMVNDSKLSVNFDVIKEGPKISDITGKDVAELEQYVENKNKELQSKLEQLLNLDDAALFEKYLRVTQEVKYENMSYQSLQTEEELKKWQLRIKAFRFQISTAKRFMDQMISEHYCGHKDWPGMRSETNVRSFYNRLTLEQIVASCYHNTFKEQKKNGEKYKEGIRLFNLIGRLYDARRGYIIDDQERKLLSERTEDLTQYIIPQDPGHDAPRCAGGIINSLCPIPLKVINEATITQDARKIVREIIDNNKQEISKLCNETEVDAWYYKNILPKNVENYVKEKFDKYYKEKFLKDFEEYDLYNIDKMIEKGFANIPMPSEVLDGITYKKVQFQYLSPEIQYQKICSREVQLLHININEEAGYQSTLNHVFKNLEGEDKDKVVLALCQHIIDIMESNLFNNRKQAKSVMCFIANSDLQFSSDLKLKVESSTFLLNSVLKVITEGSITLEKETDSKKLVEMISYIIENDLEKILTIFHTEDRLFVQEEAIRTNILNALGSAEVQSDPVLFKKIFDFYIQYSPELRTCEGASMIAKLVSSLKFDIIPHTSELLDYIWKRSSSYVGAANICISNDMKNLSAFKFFWKLCFKGCEWEKIMEIDKNSIDDGGDYSFLASNAIARVLFAPNIMNSSDTLFDFILQDIGKDLNNKDISNLFGKLSFFFDSQPLITPSMVNSIKIFLNSFPNNNFSYVSIIALLKNPMVQNDLECCELLLGRINIKFLKLEKLEELLQDKFIINNIALYAKVLMIAFEMKKIKKLDDNKLEDILKSSIIADNLAAILSNKNIESNVELSTQILNAVEEVKGKDYVMQQLKPIEPDNSSSEKSADIEAHVVQNLEQAQLPVAVEVSAISILNHVQPPLNVSHAYSANATAAHGSYYSISEISTSLVNFTLELLNVILRILQIMYSGRDWQGQGIF